LVQRQRAARTVQDAPAAEAAAGVAADVAMVRRHCAVVRDASCSKRASIFSSRDGQVIEYQIARRRYVKDWVQMIPLNRCTIPIDRDFAGYGRQLAVGR